jgi:K(+)-stimulated pyrophosphate-energized sodium pump
MAGIGMLTLTGNTISMDVFGPVADNANGIGEMAYDVKEMDAKVPGSAKRARQILSDLDAVGNTTKAETKGIAIGSAVIAAAPSSRASSRSSPSGAKKIHHDDPMYSPRRALTVADPKVFIGFSRRRGAVPLLLVLIRAVGRRLLHRQRVPGAVP